VGLLAQTSVTVSTLVIMVFIVRGVIKVVPDVEVV